MIRLFISLLLTIFTLLTLCSLVLFVYTKILYVRNASVRKEVLRSLGVEERKWTDVKLVGFFHPYCNAGGGGERVLWTAVALMQREHPDVVSVVYTGDNVSKEDIIKTVQARFNITLSPTTLHFVFLPFRDLVEDKTWPRFTLLGQSFGSMWLAFSAMTSLIPDLYIDTMGYAFTFFIVRLLTLGRAPIGAYVHYPTISTTMLSRVEQRRSGHTNKDDISNSVVLSRGKLLYYRIFMYIYSQSLHTASFLMTNSSWTQSHVDSILTHHDTFLSFIHTLCVTPIFLPLQLLSNILTKGNGKGEGLGLGIGGSMRVRKSKIVYPPCETTDVVAFPIEKRERVILSVAQFRPEKDHAAQLTSFRELLVQHPEYRTGEKAVKLVLVGGCRNEGDRARVERLKEMAGEFGIQENVEFVLNAPYPDVLNWLSRAYVGLNTMVDEHFGINVVEYMAAGVIPVVHASGGPLRDIVVPYNNQPTGYHATSPLTYAAALHEAFSLSEDEELAMRSRARTWAVYRFSRAEFEKGWEESGWKGWLN